MRGSHTIAVALILCGCASAPEHPGASAGSPITVRGAHYAASADTQYYGIWQSVTVSYVRGRDTLRLPIHNFSVLAQQWSDASDGLRIAVRRSCVGAVRCDLSKDYTISPRGRVLAIDGRPLSAARSAERILMILPDDRDLAPGVQWADSGVSDSVGLKGEIHRTYRVQRIIESQGRTLAEIVGDGMMHMHGTLRLDSTKTIWLDVSGNVRETHWFDVHANRMVSDFETTQLTGWGSMPNRNGGVDTLPAGIAFDIKNRSITSDRAHLLARALPGQDSSVTTTARRMLFLHTVERDGDAIAAGLAQTDGWVRTASERFANGRPLTYDAVWSDTSVRCCTMRHVERHGDSLLVRRDTKDTTIAVPAVTWAVGDAMNQEMLVPVLLTLPHDNVPHPVAVYRPYEGKWTVYQTQVRETDGVYLIRMVVGPQDPEELLVVTKAGDLLLAEQPRAQQPWIRMPVRGTVRRAALDDVLKRLMPARLVSGA